MPRVSRKQLAKSVIAGIEHAHRVHEHISRRRFDQAPESWVASILAMYLAEKTPGYGVELEARVGEVMQAAHARPKGRIPKDLRAGGRVDIVLWWKKKEGPRALIEVKHPVRKGTIKAVESDARRLLTALHRAAEYKTLDWGCLAFFCSSSPRQSKSEELADADIKKTLSTLKKKVQFLNRDKSFYIKLESGPMIECADKRQKVVVYGRACRIGMFRKRSAYLAS